MPHHAFTPACSCAFCPPLLPAFHLSPALLSTGDQLSAAGAAALPVSASSSLSGAGANMAPTSLSDARNTIQELEASQLAHEKVAFNYAAPPLPRMRGSAFLLGPS